MNVSFDLSRIEQKALALWAKEHGRTWKGDLVRAWKTRIGLRGHKYQEALMRLQHVLGEPGLDRIDLGEALPHKTAPKAKKASK